MFIVFEGADGCGKSTQLDRCRDWLTQTGVACTTCRDPGSTELGIRIRDMLLHHTDYQIGDRAEMLMFMVARAQLIQEIVQPALADRRVVLCDRFLLSTVVYQGRAGCLEPEDIYSVGKIATQDTLPDLTLVFDIPVSLAQARVGQDKDRMESRGSEFFEKVRQGFQQEAKRHPETIKLIDATRSIDEIHQEVKELIGPLISA